MSAPTAVSGATQAVRPAGSTAGASSSPVGSFGGTVSSAFAYRGGPSGTRSGGWSAPGSVGAAGDGPNAEAAVVEGRRDVAAERVRGSRNVRPVPARFATTGRRARSTVLVFWLSRPGRVEFVVLRAGSCSKVGAFGARGQRGVNRVRFGGRVEGRRLRPGMYTIVPVVYRSNSVTELERVTIQILRPAAKVPLWRRTALVPAQCRSVDHVATNLLAFGSGSPFDSAFTAFARTGTGSGSATPVGGVKGAEATNPDNSDGPNPIAVDADADEDEGIALPAPFGSDGLGGPSSTVALLLLSGLGFAIMALLLLVVRYIRGSWNP